MDKRIFHIKRKLSQYLGRSWTVEDMAAELRMSVANLHRLFKEENDGVTPKVFLYELRLERAREMLADPECFLGIGEIGVQVALGNESHFTQDFKAKYGMTPTKYRDHQAEIHQSRPPMGRNDSFGREMIVLDKK